MQESASNEVRLGLRFRKPFPESSSGLLRLTQAHSSQALPEIRTLAGLGWNELESGGVEH
jgi:hypothetical protein